MGNKNTVTIGTVQDSTIMNANQLNVRIVAPRRSRTAQSYPQGAIGANLMMRNYVHYLVDRYNHFRKADRSFGQGQRPFHYAVLFKNIQQKFKCPAYFVPETRFPELIDFLHAKIDGTILGKRNHSRGIRSYVSWDEYQLDQTPSS